MSLAFPEVRIGTPLRYKSLTVFPLFAPASEPVQYLLASEAIGDKLLSVDEVSEGGSVPELLVENRADIRVLFIEGEELVGAKQNRILNTSILVAANSRTKIPVSCVERGRWGYKSKSFGSSGSHSPSQLRYALKASVTDSSKRRQGRRSDQMRIWREVDALQSAHGGSTPTAAMSDTFDSHQKQVAEFREALPYADGATGVALAVGSHIVGFDLFDQPSTCRKVWNRLISGFMFDALSARDADARAETADIEQFIASTRRAEWQSVPPVGEGEEHRAEFDGGNQASALTFENSIVHESALALAEVD